MTRITAVPFRDLGERELETWATLQEQDPGLDSPYFRPELTAAVAAVRGTVEVAVMEEQGLPVGFYPFERGPRGTGRPVGGCMSDFQGVVARPDTDWTPEGLLRGCGLSSLVFDNLLASQHGFRPYQVVRTGSPHVDLSLGFDVYCSKRRSEALVEARRKARKVEREVGPLRFELASCDRQILRRLVEWKAEQYVRTKVRNIFAEPWTGALLAKVLERRDPAFAGIMSTLHVGDRLAAVQFGIRSRKVLHLWIPAFERELARYSPGMLLLVRILQAANGAGIERIDLGKGEESYKQSFKSGEIEVAEGAVALRADLRLLRKSWLRTREWVRRSPMRGIARVPVRWFRHARNRLT